MGKRPSMSGQAPKRKASKADVGSAAEELPAWAEERSWWPQLQAFLDDVLKGGRPADDYLSERFPTEAARLEFAQLLESSFAAPVPLSSGFRPGVKSFALWQICWSRHAGHKGFVAAPELRALVQLVLANGPKTNAAELAGVEFPVLEPLVKEFFPSEWSTALHPNHGGSYEAFSVGFTKGWTRGLSFLLAALFLLDQHLLDDYKSQQPTEFSRFCLLHGTVTQEFGNELDRIAANRELTMASVVTRSKPNAFNALHQLRRRAIQGQSLQDILGGYANTKNARQSILGMSPAESAAVVNLVNHLPDKVVQLLENTAREFGMFKGAFTHQFVAAEQLRVGFEPKVVGNEWRARLRNDDDSILLAVQRIIDGYRNTPAGLRKAAGQPEAARMVRIARCWMVVTEKIKAKLPDSLFQSEAAELQKMFFKGCFDEFLERLCEECPTDYDVEGLPEVKVLMARHKETLNKETLKKAESVRHQLAVATFSKMTHDLEQDQQALEKWAAAERVRKASWENVVLTHKRKRYVKGLQCVSKYSDVYLQTRCCELSYVEMMVAEWRAKVDAATNSSSETRSGNRDPEDPFCPHTQTY